MSRLTTRQRCALVALADAGEHTPARLGASIGASAHGAALTAGSLVRRGFVARTRDRGQTVYRITAQGLSEVRHEQLRVTALACVGGAILALVVVGGPLLLGRLP